MAVTLVARAMVAAPTAVVVRGMAAELAMDKAGTRDMCKFSWWIGGSGNWESSNDAMLQLDRGAGGFRGGSLLVHSHKSKCAGNKSECATLP
ncbi:pearli1-like lipid transfer protein 3 [Nicotiana attenuata]|uniref:Pearli1-like lipid transfer protein 3 n=1 Tax=Nicotiana attenuata TaxID=49451 RepID=A0A1J6IKN7_NICAT|nr:pearli1-like lipid transfer protein 3 [Nicotiana attenuata]